MTACFTGSGSSTNGNGQSTLTPQYEFWYGGLPGAGVIRGGAGLTIPTNSAGVISNVTDDPTIVPGSRTTANYNLAVGKYGTQHDATPGDFVTFLSINGFTTLDDRGPRYSYLSLTPGLRFGSAEAHFWAVPRSRLSVAFRGASDAISASASRRRTCASSQLCRCSPNSSSARAGIPSRY